MLTRATPRRTSLMLLSMMIPTSARLICRASRAICSCSRWTAGTRDNMYARKPVMKSVRGPPSSAAAAAERVGATRLKIAWEEGSGQREE